MPTVIAVPRKYTTNTKHFADTTSGLRRCTSIVLGVTPEIDEFVTSADRKGSTRLVLHYDDRLFAVRFEDDADAVLFKLMFPEI